MWETKKTTPIEKEAAETRKELVALYNSEEQIRMVLTSLEGQLNMEGTDIPDTSAVNGAYWKEIIPHLKNAKTYINKSKKDDKRIRKIIHKFHLLTNSAVQERIDHQLNNLLSIHDHIIQELDTINEKAKKNLDLCKSFSKYHKKADGFDKDAPSFVKKLNSKSIREDTNQIWEMVKSLAKRIKTILDLEKSLTV